MRKCPDPQNFPLRGSEIPLKTSFLNVSEQIKATFFFGLRPKKNVAKQGGVSCEGGGGLVARISTDCRGPNAPSLPTSLTLSQFLDHKLFSQRQGFGIASLPFDTGLFNKSDPLSSVFYFFPYMAFFFFFKDRSKFFALRAKKHQKFYVTMMERTMNPLERAQRENFPDSGINLVNFPFSKNP